MVQSYEMSAAAVKFEYTPPPPELLNVNCSNSFAPIDEELIEQNNDGFADFPLSAHHEDNYKVVNTESATRTARLERQRHEQQQSAAKLQQPSQFQRDQQQQHQLQQLRQHQDSQAAPHQQQGAITIEERPAEGWRPAEGAPAIEERCPLILPMTPQR